MNKIIKSVECNSSVVAYNSAASVGVGQACDDVVMSNLLHLGGVYVKNRLIMGFVVVGKDFYEVVVNLVAVGRSRLSRHFDAAVGHKRAFEGLVGLQADDFFELLFSLVNISGAV